MILVVKHVDFCLRLKDLFISFESGVDKNYNFVSAEYLSIFRFVRAQLTETGGAWGIGCGKSKEIVPGVYAAVTRWFHPYLFLFDFPFIQIPIRFNYRQKYSRLRCLLRVKGLVIGFYLGWFGHTLLIRKI